MAETAAHNRGLQTEIHADPQQLKPRDCSDRKIVDVCIGSRDPLTCKYHTISNLALSAMTK